MELTLMLIGAMIFGAYLHHLIIQVPTREEEKRKSMEEIARLDNEGRCRLASATPRQEDLWQLYNQRAAKELEDLPIEK